MKLYLDEKLKDGTMDSYEVNFWSFMKCTIYVQLVFTGLIYLTIFIVVAVFSLLLGTF